MFNKKLCQEEQLFVDIVTIKMKKPRKHRKRMNILKMKNDDKAIFVELVYVCECEDGT